jgi:hypothetical protein
MTVKEAQDAARHALNDLGYNEGWDKSVELYLNRLHALIQKRAEQGGMDVLLDASEMWVYRTASRMLVLKRLQDEGYTVTLTYAHLMISWNPADSEIGEL